MYTLPNKLKLFAIIFMVVGALGIVAGFYMVPKSTSEVKEMMTNHGDGHGSDQNATDGTMLSQMVIMANNKKKFMMTRLIMSMYFNNFKTGHGLLYTLLRSSFL